MALSNITREPRREITESLAGIVLFFGLAYLVWFLGGCLRDSICSDGKCSEADFVGFHILGAFAVCIIAAVSVGLLYLTHSIGESICETLADHGLELRPKRRNR